MLAGFGADFDRLQAEIGEGADVDEIDFGGDAHFLIRLDEFAAVLVGETASAFLEDVGANGEFEADILVRLRVFA